MCLQMANGDLDFLNERKTCSACCLCSVLTMDGGACKTNSGEFTDKAGLSGSEILLKNLTAVIPTFKALLVSVF